VRSAVHFQEPVDPVALGIPNYFDIIPRQNARCLKQIRANLENDKYETVQAFEADMALMFDNSVKFNGVDTPFGELTQALRRKYLNLLSNWKAGVNKKRKEGDDKSPAPSQPKKKLKLTV
jgi:transcription initiation factor TFIID subunit 2